MRVCINELTGHVCKNQETVYQKVFVVSENLCERKKLYFWTPGTHV